MEEFAHRVNRYRVQRNYVNLKGFFTIVFSGVAALLFVLGFVIPFYWFFGDPMILLAGYASLLVIVAAFILNVKTGSHLVGLTMVPMGTWNFFWVQFIEILVW